MFCKNCGKKIDDDSKFCSNCGTPVAIAEADDEDSLVVADETPADSDSEVDEDDETEDDESEYDEEELEAEEEFDFHTWIVANGFEKYEEILEDEGYDDEDMIADISEGELRDIESLDAEGRKKIYAAAQELRAKVEAREAAEEARREAERTPSANCPRCGAPWEKKKESTGAVNTLGKAIIGGILLGPAGAIGGAALGSKATVYICRQCGFEKTYKKSIVKGAAEGIKNFLK